MSIDALNVAKHTIVGSRGRKATLLLLADRANDHGVLYGGIAWMTKVLECSRATAMADLAALEEAGLLARVERRTAGGHRKTKLTVLLPFGPDRGKLLPWSEDEEFGPFLAANLAPKSEVPTLPKSENPTLQNAEDSESPKSKFQTPKVKETYVVKLDPYTVNSSVDRHLETAAAAPASASTDEEGGEAPAPSPFDAAMGRLAPLVERGLLNDPRTGGGDMVLFDALSANAPDVIVDAIGHVVAWASDGTLKARDLSRLLPTAIRKAKATPGPRDDRPLLDDVVASIDTAVRRHGRQRARALAELASTDPVAVALAAVTDWDSWCSLPRDQFEGRKWMREVADTYRSLDLNDTTAARDALAATDDQATGRHADQIDLVRQERARMQQEAAA